MMGTGRRAVLLAGFRGRPKGDLDALANVLCTREYREPYVVPEVL
jgi:hypothetical protein